MASQVTNILLSSFPGLGLPSTLCIPVSSSSSISEFTSLLSQRLPSGLLDTLTLTTSSNKAITPSSSEPVSAFLSGGVEDGSILRLRLNGALYGGKGGFGSQLRAAGGRMSSRKKRAQGENSGSSRNLDGRRLRTVTEAKALAEYLAVKPEMDKKEKEERRKRWEQVVEASERREEEIRNGEGKGKVDGDWVDAKEEAEAKTREAVMAAMQSGLLRDDTLRIGDEDEEMDEESDSSSESDANVKEGSSSKATTPPSGEETRSNTQRKVFGWDDEEDISDSEVEDDEGGEEDDE